MSELEIYCATFMGFIIVFGSLVIYFTYGMLAGDIDILRERYYNLSDKMELLCKKQKDLQNEMNELKDFVFIALAHKYDSMDSQLKDELKVKATKLKSKTKQKMTLSEAIEHAEQKAKELGDCECAKEHLQLAEWLKELQEFKKQKELK